MEKKNFCYVCKHRVMDMEKHLGSKDHKRRLRGPVFSHLGSRGSSFKRGVKKHYGGFILRDRKDK